MNFLELIFGMAPDEGSGSLEFVLLIAVAAGVTAYASSRQSRRRLRRTQASRIEAN